LGRGLVAVLALAVIAVGLIVVLGGSDDPTERVGFSGGPDSGRATVWAVGDAADGGEGAAAVAAMVAAADPDRFIYLGDVYDEGTQAEFEENYAPSFGALAPITLPTPGNHDWGNRAEGYDPYWAEFIGGAQTPDHYSVDIAGWQLISLNSEAPHDAESEQWQWLQNELESGGNCRIAFFHRPRYSAGSHGDQGDIAPLWDSLVGNATLVLNGHEHNMQRLEEIDGLTTLISGGGGKSHYSVNASDERLAFADDEHDGALELVLEPGQVRWRFVAVGGEVLDQGQAPCQS
jgi:Calcineurin-like phosphoesterase